MVVLGHGCEPSCAKDGSHVLRTQIWAEELRLLPVSVKQKPQMTRDLKAFMHGVPSTEAIWLVWLATAS